MKNIVFIVLSFFLFCIQGISQKIAQFEMKFYFEDARGNKDTLFFRADSSIVDDETKSSDDLNLDWDESIDNSPFDSILDVRAKPSAVIGGNFYNNIINKAYDNGQGCIAPKPLLIFVYTKYWPIKMTWNQDYFRDHGCLFGTFATPDAEYAKKWLFNDPVPIREIACLGNQNQFVKDLRESELFSNWELPYETFHEVIGNGKIPITAIQFYFGKPWAHLCDTLSSLNDFEKLNITVFPTILSNQLRIVNPNSELLDCRIINIEGKEFDKFVINNSEYYKELEHLSFGLYLLIMQNSKGMKIVKKFIKT